MTLSEFSVKRKVAMCSFILMLIFLGMRMYTKIGIDSLPKFDVPAVQITAAYPGASPEEIETDVAKRIEDAVASMDGLKHTTTICMENAALITLEFEMGYDADLLIHEVREKINLIQKDFPAGAETPELGKINFNAVPVVKLFLTGKQSRDELYDYADETLADRFSCLPGVGEVRLRGGNEMQLHIIADRKKLAESGLSIAEILSRLQTSNLKLPAGHIQENNREMSVTYDSEFRDIQALKNLEISAAQGKRIYLGDIAEIRLMSRKVRQMAYFNGLPGIQIEVVKKAGANAVEVINAVRKRFQELRQPGMMPGGMTLHWFRDSGEFIHASVDDAWSNVLAGILLTALVLFLFLHDFRSTIIAAVTIPVSIIISFLAMKALDYTFDMITLVAIGCAVGVLVDNACVVLENIFKRMKQGMPAKEAAITGTAEVIVPVSAGALTNLVVFIPVMMMWSMVGKLLCPFGGVMVAVTLASLFVSFTLTPILVSVFFAKEKTCDLNFMRWFYDWWDRGYSRMEQWFIRSMSWTCRHCVFVIALCAAVCAVLGAIAIPHLSLGAFPISDKGEISVTLEFPVNYSLQKTYEETDAILKEISKREDVVSAAATAGYVNAMFGQVPEGVYLTEANLKLIPKDKRKSVSAAAGELREMLAKKENLRYAVNIPLSTGTTEAEMIAYFTGPDYDELCRLGEKALSELRKSGMACDIDSSIRQNKPRVNIVPNRAVLRNLGIPENVLGTAVACFFDGVTAGTYKVGTRNYDIRLKTNEEEGFANAGNIVIGNLNGNPVNIDVLADFEESPVKITMIRQDKERSVWIYCNAVPGVTLGNLMSLMNEKCGKDLPAGYRLNFGGQASTMQDGARDFAEVFIAAVVLLYLLLAALLESWKLPFLIMFTVLPGFIGMFFAVYLSGEAMSMVALLGGVMMIGIVVNNAILFMDETRVLVNSGVPPHDAMIQAAGNKLRPVLITSLTSIIGMLPMAFGNGVGSELRTNCGLGVAGGLTLSTFMTVYLIPALYFLFTKKKNRQMKEKMS